MPTSNVHVLTPVPPRTTAERGLVEAFASAAQTLPGGGWVADVRARAMRRFEASGLPTRRVEAFKYTDLRERMKEVPAPSARVSTGPSTGADAGKSSTSATADMSAALDRALGPIATLDVIRIVLVDGVYRADLSTGDKFAGTTEFMPLAPLLAKAPAWLESKFADGRLGEPNAVASLNTAFMSDGVLLKIKPGQTLDKPLLMVSARSSASAQTISTRNIIAIEAGATATLIEAFVALEGAAAASLTNTFADVTVADGGNFTHIKCAPERGPSNHLSSVVAKVGSGSSYRVFQYTAGPTLARNDLVIELAGEDSKLDISGAFLARENSHIDTTLVVDHKVKGCESRELFKCVLEGRARGVFQGKIIVRPGADKTDGKQMARALLLSEDAEFDSKPELEIYADDVACGHGATAAALDDDLMFYCRSRGIPEKQARGLLIEAFIGDAMDKIEREDVREAFMGLARTWLSESGLSEAGLSESGLSESGLGEGAATSAGTGS